MQPAGRVAGRRLLQHTAAASAARPSRAPPSAIASTTSSASGRRAAAALAHADGALFGLRRGWRAFHSGLVLRLAEIVMKVPG